MTTLALDLYINRATGMLYVSSIGAPFTGGGIPSNVDFISYSGKDFQGSIIYNDRPRLPEVFLDPSTYQGLINQWINSVAGLTLAQAKSVKTAFVGALYNAKRQAPVHVATSAGAFDWDSSDSAMQQMAPVNTLNLLTALNSMIASATDIANNVDSVLGGRLISDLMSVGAANLTPPYVIQPLSHTIPSALSPPTVSIIPLGQTSAVALTTADITAISSAILSQRQTAQSGAVSRSAAIAALSTVAAVAAYDAVTGW